MQKNTSLRQRCANSHIILPYLSIKMARRTVRCLAAAARTDPAHGVFFLLIGPKNTIQDSLLLLLLVHCTVVIFSWNSPIHKFLWSVVQSVWLSCIYFSIISLFIDFCIFTKHFSIWLLYEKVAIVWLVPQFCSWCTYFFFSTICLFFGGFFAVFVLHLFLEIDEWLILKYSTFFASRQAWRLEVCK